MNHLIIDGNSLWAKSWFGQSKNGAAPGVALKGAVTSVLLLLSPQSDRIGELIHKLLFCWDGQHGLDKGPRPPKPPGYSEYRAIFQETLSELLGAAHATPAAHEADDAIATAVYRNYKKADRIFVCSGDKDLMQLQGGNVHYYSLNEHMILSKSAICRKFGVKRPSQVAIALAIIGDRTDNIKGVPRWGHKKVEQIFSSIDEKCSFSEALRLVENQIPANLLRDFQDSLDRTILAVDVPDVQDPNPIKWLDFSKVRSLKTKGISDVYLRLLEEYGAGPISEDQEDF